MWENGLRMDLGMVKDYKYGRMALNMRVIGKMTWLTAKAD